jgi:prophage regulatory protein
MENNTEQVRAIRTEQVMQITGLGRTTIFRAVKEGRFPKPLKLGERAIGWLESDVRAWLESRRVA